MNEPLLTHQQVFTLKATTLEKRILTYYQETQNSSTTIKYILALRVRYQLGAEEFSQILGDLVRYLFLNTKATRTMKRFFYYFQDYFRTSEWRRLSQRLFPLRNFGAKAAAILHSLIFNDRPEEGSEP